MNIYRISMAFLLSSLAILGGCSEQPAATDASSAGSTTEQLSEEAYVYGLQQAIFYQTRYNYTQNKTTNTFEGINRWNVVNDGNPIDTSFKAIVTPNATTAYAIGFIDMQAEPIVIEMPEVTDRYFSLQLMDAYGIFHLYAGNQYNGTSARSYLILPESYEGNVPDAFPIVDIIKVPSKSLMSLVRYARSKPQDVNDVDQIKGLLAKTTITPLSKWIENGNKGLKKEDQPVVKGNYKTFSRMNEMTTAQVDVQTAEDFFTFIQLVLNDETLSLIQDSKMEFDMLERLAAIGIGKGLDFNWSKQSAATQEVLTTGFEAARIKIFSYWW